MKKILLTLVFLTAAYTATAQAPVISGDLMLCPDTNGTATITNSATYDTYQWYFKYWFLDDQEFVPVDGATEASFTYDWFTYDQALIKVVVTQGENTYESNTIQIDSYQWAGLVIISTLGEGVTINGDNGNLMMCEGASVVNTVNDFFVNLQWYKDGEPIEGATANTYSITEPGSYYVTASPSTCTNYVNTTITQPIVAEANSDCALGIDNPAAADKFMLYPNPAKNTLNIRLGQSSNVSDYSVIDVSGKILLSGKAGSESAINISSLAAGTYLLKLSGDSAQVSKMFIKE
jgi:hypothetical protein